MIAEITGIQEPKSQVKNLLAKKLKSALTRWLAARISRSCGPSGDEQRIVPALRPLDDPLTPSVMTDTALLIPRS
jgi:hypothetical protein